jgi:hypothetical protein
LERQRVKTRGLVFLYVGPQAEQRVFGGNQLTASFIELLLLSLDEPPVGPDRLIDSAGRLFQLQMHLPGERVLEMGAELTDAALELALSLPALSGEDVEPTHRERPP